MKDLLKKILKSKVGKGLMLGVALGLLLCLLRMSGVFNSFIYKRLDSFYCSRTEVAIDPEILTWPIQDEDVEISRWPWSWAKFEWMFRTSDLFGARTGVMTDSYFSEEGSLTIFPKQKEMLKERIHAAFQETGGPFSQVYDKSVAWQNREFIELLKKRMGKNVFCQNFVIPDNQTGDIESDIRERHAFFSAKKLQAIEDMRRFGIAWKNPDHLLQAVDVEPLSLKLTPVVDYLGFMRIWADSDGTIRRCPAVVYYDGYIYFSEPILMAAQKMGVAVKDFELIPGSHLRIPSPEGKDKDIVIPIDEQGLMYANWVGPNHATDYPTLPFSLVRKLMEPFVLRDVLRNVPYQEDLLAYILDLKKE